MKFFPLDNLSEDEGDMLLYVVNIVFPTTFPKIEHTLTTVKWLKHEVLLQKLQQAEPKVLPEFKPVFDGLMLKLGVQVKREEPKPPEAPVTASVEMPVITGSMEIPLEVPVTASVETPLSGSI